MGGSEIAVIIAAILGGTLVKTILDFLTNRVLVRAQTKVATATVAAQIESAELAGLMAKLVYLERLLENQSKYIQTLQEDRNAADERARRWETRVRELEDLHEQLRSQIRTHRMNGDQDVP